MGQLAALGPTIENDQVDASEGESSRNHRTDYQLTDGLSLSYACLRGSNKGADSNCNSTLSTLRARRRIRKDVSHASFTQEYIHKYLGSMVLEIAIYRSDDQ